MPPPPEPLDSKSPSHMRSVLPGFQSLLRDLGRPSTSPIHNISLPTLVQRATTLRDANDIDAFLNLVVTGKETDCLIRLATTVGRPAPAELWSMWRKFGLIIGVSRDLLLSGATLQLCDILGNEFFDEDARISHLWLGHDGFRVTPVHKIPQVPLGKYGVRSLLILLFPNAPQDSGPPKLSYKHWQHVMDHIVKPALFSVTGLSSPFNATLLPHQVPLFGQEITKFSQRCEIPDLQGVLFLHIGREPSPIHGLDAPPNELNDHLSRNFIPYDSIPHAELYAGTWYVDVVAEAAIPDTCLVWNAKRLEDLFCHITSTKLGTASQYKRFYTSHIADAAGCLAVLNQNALPEDTADYVFVDMKIPSGPKSVEQETMEFASLAPRKRADDVGRHLRRLASTYDDLRDAVPACIYVRCHLASAHEALVQLEPRYVFESTLRFDCESFWKWRALRSEALSALVERSLQVGLEELDVRSMALVAEVVRCATSLTSANLDDVDEDEGVVTKSLNRGMLFLENVYVGKRSTFDPPRYTYPVVRSSMAGRFGFGLRRMPSRVGLKECAALLSSEVSANFFSPALLFWSYFSRANFFERELPLDMTFSMTDIPCLSFLNLSLGLQELGVSSQANPFNLRLAVLLSMGTRTSLDDPDPDSGPSDTQIVLG
ncbi:hypothetical protein NMY22_g1129 [Coprinellus aureogranulatus]|nr:hypothetical protein NMY22_g1129 [Coprinellus aureogranulatus]